MRHRGRGKGVSMSQHTSREFLHPDSWVLVYVMHFAIISVCVHMHMHADAHDQALWPPF